MRLRTVPTALAALALAASALAVTAPGALAEPPEAAPVLTSTAVPDTGDVLLTWDRVLGASGYTVQVSLDPTFVTTVESVDTQGTLWAPTVTLAGTPEGARTYYWRVRAYGTGPTDYSATSTSESGQFTRATLPAPTATSPGAVTPGTVAYPNPVTFRWEPVPGATSYRLDYGTDDTFQATTTVTTTAATYVPPALMSRGTTYYWRVTANLGAISTPPSSTASFTVTWPGSSPTPLAPVDGSTMTDVEFRWSPVAGAAYYKVDVATNDGFTTLAVNGQKVIGTVYSPDLALLNESYWWRVTPYDAADKAGQQSSVGFFRRAWGKQQGAEFGDWTGTSDYPRPTLGATTEGAAPALPVDGLELTWEAFPRASHYEVQVVAASENFDTASSSDRLVCFTPNSSVTVLQKTDSTGMSSASRLRFPSASTGCLQPKSGISLTAGSGTYKWRVRAVDLSASTTNSFQSTPTGVPTSAWSDSQSVGDPGRRYFTVGAAELAPSALPTPTSPANGVDVHQAPTLHWTPVADRLSYRIEVALDASFTNGVVTAVTSQPLLRLDGALADNTTSDSYYWRVTACAAAPAQSSLQCDTTTGPVSRFHKVSSPVALNPVAVDPATSDARVSWVPPQVDDAQSYDGGVRGYETQVATTNAFNGGDVKFTTKTDTPFMSSTVAGRALSNGTYYVRTRALDAAGWPFEWSDTRSFVIAKATPVLDAVSTGASPTLGWHDPAGAYLAGTTYDVRYWLASSAAGSITPTGLQHSGATLTNLAPGSYKWQVRAKDAFGTVQGFSSEGSFVVGGTSPVLTTPDASQFGIADRLLTWDAVPGVASYVLRTSTSPAMTSATTNATVQTQAAPKGNFAYGTTYYWDVQALSEGGKVLATSPVRTFTVRTVPGLPALGTPVAVGDTANVTWTAPVGANLGSATGVTHLLRYRVNGSGDTWTTVGPFTGTSTSVSGLPMETTFEFQLAALGVEGRSPWTASKVVSTKGLPGEPRSLAATPSAQQVKLTWSAPSAAGAGVTGYAVRYVADGGDWVDAGTVTGTTTTVTSLSADTMYVVEVAAVSAYGPGPAAAVTFTGVDVPSAPSLTTAAPGDRKATLAWSAPVTTGGSPVTGYLLEMRSTSGGTWSAWATKSQPGATTDTLVVSGLTNGTAYEFRVSAKNKYGTGVPSQAKQVVPSDGSTTPPTNPPTTPTAKVPGKVVGVKAVAKKKHTVVLSWSPAAANGAAITGYQVQAHLKGKPWVALGTVKTTSLTWTKGKKKKVYWFQVRATNAKGAGAYSAPVKVKVKK